MEKLKFEAKPENLERMIDFIVNKYAEQVKDKKSINKMRLVSEEALINIINYAYPNQSGEIEISYNYDSVRELLELQISDRGIPFNPLDHEEPNLEIPLEDRQIGGLGIFMIKQIMDSVHYERLNEQNILTLTKQLPKEGI